MAIKKTIEIEAIAKDAIDQIQKLNEKVEGLEDSLKKAGEQTNKTNKLLTGLRNLARAGLGLVVYRKHSSYCNKHFHKTKK